MPMPDPIPAITLWQPWASLTAAGAKPYEWRGDRTTRMARAHIGKRIAIHAGARKVRPAEIFELLIELEKGRGASTSLDAAIAIPLLRRWHVSPALLPLSSMLCTATLGEPITAATYAAERGVLPAYGNLIDHTKWGLPLTGIDALQPFVPATGARGFWPWTPPRCLT